MSLGFVLARLIDSILLALILTITSMVFGYIAMIRGRLHRVMIGDLDLMNKMHEGMIVVSKEERKLQFASKPAVKILQSEPLEASKLGVVDRSAQSDNQSNSFKDLKNPLSCLNSSDLRREIFKPTTVSVNTAASLN